MIVFRPRVFFKRRLFVQKTLYKILTSDYHGKLKEARTFL
jgi:hypothetical protein